MRSCTAPATAPAPGYAPSGEGHRFPRVCAGRAWTTGHTTGRGRSASPWGTSEELLAPLLVDGSRTRGGRADQVRHRRTRCPRTGRSQREPLLVELRLRDPEGLQRPRTARRHSGRAAEVDVAPSHVGAVPREQSAVQCDVTDQELHATAAAGGDLLELVAEQHVRLGAREVQQQQVLAWGELAGSRTGRASG